LCNGRREHLEILAYYGGNSPDKGILEKLKKKKEGLGLSYYYQPIETLST
jgi:hypothetical protein